MRRLFLVIILILGSASAFARNQSDKVEALLRQDPIVEATIKVGEQYGHKCIFSFYQINEVNHGRQYDFSGVINCGDGEQTWMTVGINGSAFSEAGHPIFSLNVQYN
jgi:hypothetical protein